MVIMGTVFDNDYEVLSKPFRATTTDSQEFRWEPFIKAPILYQYFQFTLPAAKTKIRSDSLKYGLWTLIMGRVWFHPVSVPIVDILPMVAGFVRFLNLRSPLNILGSPHGSGSPRYVETGFDSIKLTFQWQILIMIRRLELYVELVFCPCWRRRR